MTFIATYKTEDGIELTDTVGYDMESALEDARREAKKHGWKLISVKYPEPKPTPQIVYPQLYKRHTDLGPEPYEPIIIRG